MDAGYEKVVRVPGDCRPADVTNPRFALESLHTKIAVFDRWEAATDKALATLNPFTIQHLQARQRESPRQPRLFYAKRRSPAGPAGFLGLNTKHLRDIVDLRVYTTAVAQAVEQADPGWTAGALWGKPSSILSAPTCGQCHPAYTTAF